MSDTAEDNANFIVDCDILEKAKENIQPLAGGRSATALAAVLKTPHAHRDTRLASTKARLRARVNEAKAEVDKLAQNQANPSDQEEEEQEQDENEEEKLTLEEAEEMLLSAYVQLVTWTVEHYPRGQSVESGILELLEEATRVMRHSLFAKADPRYLNLWLRYASYVDKPEVIFEFLLANDIGTDWAKMYEEYALVLERLDRRSKADEIYLLGINRRAEPLDHLQRRHKDFQKRMMVAAPAPSSEPERLPLGGPTGTIASIPNASDSVAPRRKILGDSTSFVTSSSFSTPGSQQSRIGLPSTSSTHDVFSPSLSSTSTSTSFTGLPPSSSSSSSSHTPNSTSRPNARLPIFVDPTGSRSEAGERSAWPELGTRKERVKENVRTAEKMEGTVLKQRGAARAATKQAGVKARAAPKIVPFRDPEGDATANAVGGPPLASSSKIIPFRDTEPPAGKVKASSGLSAKKSVSKSTTSKTPFVPFVDDEQSCAAVNAGKKSTSTSIEAKSSTSSSAVVAATDSAPVPPVATKFVPFKDPTPDHSPISQPSALPVPDSVMRPKTVITGEGAVTATSEAEALRKDPFKNYKD